VVSPLAETEPDVCAARLMLKTKKTNNVVSLSFPVGLKLRLKKTGSLVFAVVLLYIVMTTYTRKLTFIMRGNVK